MADKDFKVKNKLFVNGLSNASGVILATNNNLDSSTTLPTQYGGTGTTTSPNAGQVLYSSSGTTYAPITFTSLPGVYARGNTASRPASPVVGDLYYNTQLNYFEVYTANGWFPIAAAPGIPTGVTATNQGTGRAFNNGQMSVAFTPNSSGGAASSFIVTPSPSTSPSTFSGGTSPITVTGLASSTQYTYTVVATSPYGTSSASSASTGVTATTVPQAPTLTAAAASATTATITITPGGTGGSSITQYSITSSPATTTQTTSNTTYTFTGLTTGTSYTFTATATNANGTSQTSSASNSVVPAVPGSFESIATASGGNASVTFSSIPQTYKHLQIRIYARNDGLSGPRDIRVRFNGDGNSNYRWHSLRGSVSTISASNGTGVDLEGYLYFGMTPSQNNGNQTTVYSAGIFDIHDYSSTSKTKTVRGYQGYQANNATGNIFYLDGHWNSTSAISSIFIESQAGSFTGVSNIALYGIKE